MQVTSVADWSDCDGTLMQLFRGEGIADIAPTTNVGGSERSAHKYIASQWHRDVRRACGIRKAIPPNSSYFESIERRK